MCVTTYGLRLEYSYSEFKEHRYGIDEVTDQIFGAMEGMQRGVQLKREKGMKLKSSIRSSLVFTTRYERKIESKFSGTWISRLSEA